MNKLHGLNVQLCVRGQDFPKNDVTRLKVVGV
jgi:hypothetical protein